MPLHEHTVLQRRRASRTPRVQRGDALFHKVITDCKFHRAAENSSHYSGVTQTQTILAEIEIRGRQVFTPRGFGFGDQLGEHSDMSHVTVWSHALSLPCALRKIVYTGFCRQNEKHNPLSGDRQRCMTTWWPLQRWTRASPGATGASHSAATALLLLFWFFFLLSLKHNPILKPSG